MLNAVVDVRVWSSLTLHREPAAGVGSAHHQTVVSLVGGIRPVKDQALFCALGNHLDSVAGLQQLLIVEPLDRADVLS